MLISRLISQVMIAGDGSDNPVPFGPGNFEFDANQQQLTFQEKKVIVFHNRLQAMKQVTGMVVVGQNGQPMLGPNDTVYMPCPPFCQRGD